MAKVMKSFRLSESAIAALENRDTQKYRSGQEYIEALLLNHEEKSEPTIETVLEELKKYDSNELYVIGGGSIYEMLIPYCDTAYITKIDHAYAADTYFPNLDQMDDWEMTEVSEEQTCFDLEYVFAKYERK